MIRDSHDDTEASAALKRVSATDGAKLGAAATGSVYNEAVPAVRTGDRSQGKGASRVRRGRSALLIAAGVVLAGGAAYFAARKLAETATGPDYRRVHGDGDFEIRDYGAMIVAETVKSGYHETARQRGTQTLLGYISGQNRAASRIPVSPLILQQLSGAGAGATGWAIRFVMPGGLGLSDLPSPVSAEVRLKEVPPRRVAAIRFPGRFTASLAAKKLVALYDHLGDEDLRRADPEYAFYNLPWIPGPARRNEILIEIAS